MQKIFYSKTRNFLKNSYLWLFLALLNASFLFSQTAVVVPNDIVPSDFASNAVAGWRLLSTGNSSSTLVSVTDFGLPANFGSHSVRASRPGGSGVNRSFLGYWESGRALASLENFSWNRYSEQGNDSYLNIFITNGQAVATVVYQPATIIGSWNQFTFNSGSVGNISIRINSQTINLTYAQLISEFGNWIIYNHPNTFVNLTSASDFIGGLVLVSGSSSPTAAQTHTFDGVTIKFQDSESTTYDFVAAPAPPPAGCFAIEEISYFPGKRKNGLDLPVERTNTSKALGQPQNSDIPVPESELNFVTLGFGGTIVLKMEQAIKNGPGNDLAVFETTYGALAGNCAKYPEKIKGFASQDGCNWVYMGEICQDGQFDLKELNWAQYFRFNDVSPLGFFFGGNEDGYDLDGIECLNGYEENPVIQDLGAFFAMQVVPNSFQQGKRRNLTNVLNERSNPNKALFQPENNNTINFVSLGFGGSVILKMGYVVFNKPGTDLQLFETSFGNPSCNSYPERANIEVSLDGVNFTSLGVFCLDASLDFSVANVPYAQYVRITDRSKRSDFTATADGYDVDGLTVINPGCSNGIGQRFGEESIDGGLISEETVEINILQNPSAGQFQVSITTSDQDDRLTFSLFNLSGQQVWSNQVSLAANQNTLLPIDITNLSSGIYLLSVDGINGREHFKLVKQ